MIGHLYQFRAGASMGCALQGSLYQLVRPAFPVRATNNP
jgi:hypothetical protein